MYLWINNQNVFILKSFNFYFKHFLIISKTNKYSMILYIKYIKYLYIKYIKGKYINGK